MRVGWGGWLWAATAPGARDTAEDERCPAFWWGLLLGLPLAVLVWLWWRMQCGESASSAPLPEKRPIDLTDLPAAPPPTSPAPASADDLRRIEGIGPKVAALLRDAGIQTYAQLAASEQQHLAQILVAAGLHFIDPGTWPEQAALAVQGDWAALDVLQGALKGGRRV